MNDVQHPINAFSPPLQNIINHYSEIKGYPSEYFITAMLAAASTSLGRAVTLKAGSYTAIGIIWAAIIGKPGITKSPAQDDAFKPVKDLQFQWLRDWQRDKEEIDQRKADNPKDKTPVQYPIIKQMMLNDITPEALSQALAQNAKGCGIVYDELAGFMGRFNRYNSGADEQMFLSLFNGDTVLRTRVNSNANAAIKNSFLSIVGTIQPSVLKTVFANKSESGFFDRWLMCFPDGLKKQYPNAFSVDPNIEIVYHTIIKNLVNLNYDENFPTVIEYSDTSYKIANAYQRKLIDIQNDTDSDAERAILAKMEIYLHRFSLLLHCLHWCYEGGEIVYQVTDEAAAGAVILCEYFIQEAHKIRVINPIEALKDNWKLIYEALPEPGRPFDTAHFIKVAKVNGVEKRRAAIFLKDHSESSEAKLFFKVKHGTYSKNTF